MHFRAETKFYHCFTKLDNIAKGDFYNCIIIYNYNNWIFTKYKMNKTIAYNCRQRFIVHQRLQKQSLFFTHLCASALLSNAYKSVYQTFYLFSFAVIKRYRKTWLLEASINQVILHFSRNYLQIYEKYKKSDLIVLNERPGLWWTINHCLK